MSDRDEFFAQWLAQAVQLTPQEQNAARERAARVLAAFAMDEAEQQRIAALADELDAEHDARESSLHALEPGEVSKPIAGRASVPYQTAPPQETALDSQVRAVEIVTLRVTVKKAMKRLSASRTNLLTCIRGFDVDFVHLQYDDPYPDPRGGRLSSIILGIDVPEDVDLAQIADRLDFVQDDQSDLASDVQGQLDILQRSIDHTIRDLHDNIPSPNRLRQINLNAVRSLLVKLDDYLDAAVTTLGHVTAIIQGLSVEAAGADLSGIEIQDLDVLEGVTWTRNNAFVADTTWPTGLTAQVLAISKELEPELDPGLYTVGGNPESVSVPTPVPV